MEIKKIQHIIKLSQNENPFGPSPEAMKAVVEDIKNMSCYPEPHARSLKVKIAQQFDRDIENVFVSAGLVESLDILIRNFIGEDENLVIPELSFVAYKLLADVFKKEVRLSKMTDYHVNVDDLLSLCDDKTKVIIIANPNNPTGTVISEAELLQILNAVSSSTLVVMDEAYIEYSNSIDYPDSLKLQEQYPNLLIMRTFSKIYGLAGLRVGYTIATKELIEQFEFYQAPFTVNQMASTAAFHALTDNDFVKMSAASNQKCRKKLYDKFVELGYNVVPSESNFLFVHFASSLKRDEIYNELEKRNVLIRKMEAFGEEKAFRITIGTPEMNNTVMQCLVDIAEINTVEK
jgi:histidinol-phosphate aminotransferase